MSSHHIHTTPKDHDLAMASAQLHEMAHMAGHILTLLKENDSHEIKAWVQSKLSTAHKDLSDIRTYLRGVCCKKGFKGDRSSCGCLAP